MAALSLQVPIPQPDESFDRFTIRAHQELLDRIADPTERNEVVKNSWRTHRGATTEEQQADRCFPLERYDRSEDHCVFAEHETVRKVTQPNGTVQMVPVKYGLRELASIVRQHNREIRDVGAFPSITNHHTPDDPQDPNARHPDVIGHAGPFRLGMIGAENPRWAIFADEFRRKDAVPIFDANPFRSPEVWTFKDGRRRFHPIAVVGAEAPRLQMPAKYQQLVVNGESCEKYTVAAVATPAGGSNTFIPSPGSDHEPAQYTSDETKGDNMAADPELVKAVLAAIAETPQFKYLEQCMQKDMAAAQQPAASGAPPAAPAGPPASPEPPAAPPGPPGTKEDEPDKNAYSEDDDLADLSDLLENDGPPAPEKHSMGSSQPGVISVDKYAQLQNAYSQLQGSHNNLVKHTQKQNERLQVLERETADSKRKARIGELAGKYAIDPREEESLCLYSSGSNMSDAEFSAHVAAIEKYGARADSPMVPRGEMPERYTAANRAEVEKYEQRLSEEAVRINSAASARGQFLDWNQCVAEAQKAIGPAPK